MGERKHYARGITNNAPTRDCIGSSGLSHKEGIIRASAWQKHERDS